MATECLKTLVLYSAERDIPAIVGLQGVLSIGDREERFFRKDRGTSWNIPFGEESLTSDSRSRDFEQRHIRSIRDAEFSATPNSFPYDHAASLPLSALEEA